MFKKERIAICTPTPTGMTATLFFKTRKGLTLEKRIDPVTFAALKTTYHISRVRMLLSENDTYLKLAQFPKGTTVIRDMVKEYIQGVIPESVDDGYMDWKTVSTHGDTVSVQVFVVKASVLAPLLSDARDAGVIIEACEPPSLAMARLTKHIQDSFLLVYPPAKPAYLVAVSGGKVLEVASVDALHSFESAKQTFVSYIKKMWGVTLTAIATDMPNPIVGLASKTDFQGEDMEVLTIPSDAPTKRSFSVPLPLLIIGIAVLTMAVSFFVIRLVRQGTTGQVKTEQSGVVIPTPQPTEAPVRREDVRVEVQNGSGEPGLAAKGKAVLEEAGYTGVTTGNADNYDYEGVIVKGKTMSIAAFVLADVVGTYSTATVSSTLIDTEATPDAILLLGRE